MTNSIALTEEKIAVSKNLIALLENRILDKHTLTHQMLNDLKTEIENLLISDF